MTRRISLFKLSVLALSTLTGVLPHCAQANTMTLTFDDITIPSGVSYINIPNGYGGLQWNNFGVLNAYTEFGTGYYNGMVSPNNVAFDPYGFPASFSSATSFNLDSLYLTSAYQSSMQVEVQGFIGSTLAYDHTYTVGDGGSTFLNLNYDDVTEVNFIPPSFQGQFVIDNMTITVPETCATVVLFGISLLSLGIAQKRLQKQSCAKRACLTTT